MNFHVAVTTDRYLLPVDLRHYLAKAFDFLTHLADMPNMMHLNIIGFTANCTVTPQLAPCSLVYPLQVQFLRIKTFAADIKCFLVHLQGQVIAVSIKINLSHTIFSWLQGCNLTVAFPQNLPG